MASFSFKEMKIAFDNIENQLICRICNGYPERGEPRWYRCTGLHQICQDCKEAKGKDSCKCGNPIIRDHCQMTEAFLKVKTRSKCKNVKRGCQEILGEEEMVLHAPECIFRLVPCPYVLKGICPEPIDFQTVLQHNQDKHESEKFPLELIGVDKGKKQYSLTPELKMSKVLSFPNVKMECGGQVFLIAGQRNGDVFYQWVHCLGSPDVAKRFAYTLEYQGSKFTLKFVGEAIPIDVAWHTIIKDRQCFAYGFEPLMTQFVDENLKIEFSVQIRDLKEEVKDTNEESGISDDADNEA